MDNKAELEESMFMFTQLITCAACARLCYVVNQRFVHKSSFLKNRAEFCKSKLSFAKLHDYDIVLPSVQSNASRF